MKPIAPKPIVQLLNDIRPEFDFTTSEDYLGDGMLDSFDIVTLVADLDRTFSISIEGTDILPENFQNLQAVQKLLEKYGVNA